MRCIYTCVNTETSTSRGHGELDANSVISQMRCNDTLLIGQGIYTIDKPLALQYISLYPLIIAANYTIIGKGDKQTIIHIRDFANNANLSHSKSPIESYMSPTDIDKYESFQPMACGDVNPSTATFVISNLTMIDNVLCFTKYSNDVIPSSALDFQHRAIMNFDNYYSNIVLNNMTIETKLWVFENETNNLGIIHPIDHGQCPQKARIHNSRRSYFMVNAFESVSLSQLQKMVTINSNVNISNVKIYHNPSAARPFLMLLYHCGHVHLNNIEIFNKYHAASFGLRMSFEDSKHISINNLTIHQNYNYAEIIIGSRYNFELIGMTVYGHISFGGSHTTVKIGNIEMEGVIKNKSIKTINDLAMLKEIYDITLFEFESATAKINNVTISSFMSPPKKLHLSGLTPPPNYAMLTCKGKFYQDTDKQITAAGISITNIAFLNVFTDVPFILVQGYASCFIQNISIEFDDSIHIDQDLDEMKIDIHAAYIVGGSNGKVDNISISGYDSSSFKLFHFGSTINLTISGIKICSINGGNFIDIIYVLNIKLDNIMIDGSCNYHDNVTTQMSILHRAMIDSKATIHRTIYEYTRLCTINSIANSMFANYVITNYTSVINTEANAFFNLTFKNLHNDIDINGSSTNSLININFDTAMLNTIIFDNCTFMRVTNFKSLINVTHPFTGDPTGGQHYTIINSLKVNPIGYYCNLTIRNSLFIDIDRNGSLDNLLSLDSFLPDTVSKLPCIWTIIFENCQFDEFDQYLIWQGTTLTNITKININNKHNSSKIVINNCTKIHDTTRTLSIESMLNQTNINNDNDYINTTSMYNFSNNNIWTNVSNTSHVSSISIKDRQFLDDNKSRSNGDPDSRENANNMRSNLKTYHGFENDKFMIIFYISAALILVAVVVVSTITCGAGSKKPNYHRISTTDNV